MKLKKFVSGFTILELLLALTIGCTAILATSSLLGQILLSSTRVAQREELARSLFWAAERMARDIRRAGFRHPTAIGQPQPLRAPLIITNHHAEQVNSCVLISYMSNLDAHAKGWHSATFGYRLYRQNLETQSLKGKIFEPKTNTVNCNGADWEDLLDPDLFRVEQFLLERPPDAAYLLLTLSASLVRQPQLRESLQMVVPLANIP